MSKKTLLIQSGDVLGFDDGTYSIVGIDHVYGLTVGNCDGIWVPCLGTPIKRSMLDEARVTKIYRAFYGKDLTSYELHLICEGRLQDHVYWEREKK